MNIYEIRYPDPDIGGGAVETIFVAAEDYTAAEKVVEPYDPIKNILEIKKLGELFNPSAVAVKVAQPSSSRNLNP